MIAIGAAKAAPFSYPDVLEDFMEDLKLRLQNIALKKTEPFCSSCYEKAPSGCCERCHSDDLMKSLEGVGVGWGCDWVIEHLIETNLTRAETRAAFEESVAECYPDPVKIGWISYDVPAAIRALDPVSWDLSHSEWIDQEVEDGILVTFDGGASYYWRGAVEDFINEMEIEIENGN